MAWIAAVFYALSIQFDFKLTHYLHFVFVGDSGPGCDRSGFRREARLASGLAFAHECKSGRALRRMFRCGPNRVGGDAVEPQCRASIVT
jgi:hypothetical protein